MAEICGSFGKGKKLNTCESSTRGSVDFPTVRETLTLAKALKGGEKEEEKGGKSFN